MLRNVFLENDLSLLQIPAATLTSNAKAVQETNSNGTLASNSSVTPNIQFHRGPSNHFHLGMANFSTIKYLQRLDSLFEATEKGDRRGCSFDPELNLPTRKKTLDRLEVLKDQKMYYDDQKMAEWLNRPWDDHPTIDNQTWLLLFLLANHTILQREPSWKLARTSNMLIITRLIQISKKSLNIPLTDVESGNAWKFGYVHQKPYQELETRYMTLKGHSSPNLYKEPPNLLPNSWSSIIYKLYTIL